MARARPTPCRSTRRGDRRRRDALRAARRLASTRPPGAWPAPGRPAAVRGLHDAKRTSSGDGDRRRLRSATARRTRRTTPGHDRPAPSAGRRVDAPLPRDRYYAGAATMMMTRSRYTTCRWEVTDAAAGKSFSASGIVAWTAKRFGRRFRRPRRKRPGSAAPDAATRGLRRRCPKPLPTRPRRPLAATRPEESEYMPIATVSSARAASSCLLGARDRARGSSGRLCARPARAPRQPLGRRHRVRAALAGWRSRSPSASTTDSTIGVRDGRRASCWTTRGITAGAPCHQPAPAPNGGARARLAVAPVAKQTGSSPRSSGYIRRGRDRAGAPTSSRREARRRGEVTRLRPR